MRGHHTDTKFEHQFFILQLHDKSLRLKVLELIFKKQNSVISDSNSEHPQNIHIL